MRTSQVFVFLGFALALSGCATVALNPHATKVETKLSAVPALPVRASPSVLSHTDSFRGAGLPFANETGKSFVRVFSGTAPEMPVIEIVSASLTSTVVNAGFASDFVYEVTIRITSQNTVRDVSARATHRATGFDGPGKSAKIVTEDAIAQLAEKVREIINGRGAMVQRPR